jgi:hypothetical protein
MKLKRIIRWLRVIYDYIIGRQLCKRGYHDWTSWRTPESFMLGMIEVTAGDNEFRVCKRSYCSECESRQLSINKN